MRRTRAVRDQINWREPKQPLNLKLIKRNQTKLQEIKELKIMARGGKRAGAGRKKGSLSLCAAPGPPILPNAPRRN
jgi:hypothetical protein